MEGITICMGLAVLIGIVDLLLDYRRTPIVLRMGRAMRNWDRDIQRFSAQNVFEQPPAISQDFSEEDLDKFFRITKEIKYIRYIWTGMIFLVFVLAAMAVINEGSFYDWALATIWGLLSVGAVVSCKEENKIKDDTEMIGVCVRTILSLRDKRNEQFLARSAELGRFLALIEKN